MLCLSTANYSATFRMVARLLGSEAAVQDVISRCLRILVTGSENVERNWGPLLGLVNNDKAAAVAAVRNYPKLLAVDLSRGMFRQRLRFYEEEVGVGQEAVLCSYIGEPGAGSVRE